MERDLREQGHTQELYNFEHALPVKRSTLLRDMDVRLHLNTWGHHSRCCCSSRAFAIFADFA